MAFDVKKLATTLGAAVDQAVPVATGDRTQLSVLLLLLLKLGGPFVPPPYNALVPVAAQIVTVAAPLFAAAHLVRPS